MGEGVVTLVIGMTIVFSVLILLWLILLGFEKVFYTIPNKKKKKENIKKTVEISDAVVTPMKSEIAEDESEIIAVITAAISAMTGMNSSKFNIKSIKRISNWNK